jgi:hypothetical protein
MWTWDQSAGELRRDGAFVGKGYSGNGRGKNNPSLQAAKGVGPIPRGKWKLTSVYDSKNTGPYTVVVQAQDGTVDDVHQPTGRSAFRIHGDSVKNPGTASHGCIILPRILRERMWKSGDHLLEVVE